MQEERRRKEQGFGGRDGGSDHALAGRELRETVRASLGRKINGNCYNCGRAGHIARFCRAERPRPGERKFVQAKAAVEMEEHLIAARAKGECGTPLESRKDVLETSPQPLRDEGVGDRLAAPNSGSPGISEISWFVDSRASSHMTAHREWLENYATLDRIIRGTAVNWKQWARAMSLWS